MKKWLLLCLIIFSCSILNAAGDVYTWNDPEDAPHLFTDGTKWYSPDPGSHPLDGDHIRIPHGYVVMDDGSGMIDGQYPRRIYSLNPASLTITGGTLYGGLGINDPDEREFHLHIGRGSGVSTAIQQTGGTFYADSVTFGVLGAQVHYEMSGGVYTSHFTVLGAYSGSAVMTVTGQPYMGPLLLLRDNAAGETWVNQLGGGWVVGGNNGTGVLNINGGVFSASARTYDPDFGFRGLAVGAGGTGTLNVSDGYVYSDTFELGVENAGFYSRDEFYGRGEANYTGGMHETVSMIVGSGNAEGRINISANGYLRVQNDAVIGSGEGSAVIRQTGGKFSLDSSLNLSAENMLAQENQMPQTILEPLSADDTAGLGISERMRSTPGMFIGRDLTGNGSAIYQISGGKFECHDNVYLGAVTHSENRENTLARWDISGNAEVEISRRNVLNQAPQDILQLGEPAMQLMSNMVIRTNLADDDRSSCNLIIGAPQNANINDYAETDFTRSEVNISGGKLFVEGYVTGGSSKSSLNILGSKAEINVGGILAGPAWQVWVDDPEGNPENLDGPPGFWETVVTPTGWNINFTLDKHGASTIHVDSTNLSDADSRIRDTDMAREMMAGEEEEKLSSGYRVNRAADDATTTADLRNGMTVSTPGFLSLKADTIDLVSSTVGILLPEGFETGDILAAGQENPLIKNQTPFKLAVHHLSIGEEGGGMELMDIGMGGKKDIVRLEMVKDAGTPTWNLLGTYVVNGDEGLERGMLYVEGKYTYLTATFKGVEDSDLAELLMNYLNDTVVDTGVRFSMMGYSETDEWSLLLTGSYLNGGDSGYAWFGWDLSAFNDFYNSNISLLEFGEVPEPATWTLLLLGGAAIFRCGYFRRKKAQSSQAAADAPAAVTCPVTPTQLDAP